MLSAFSRTRSLVFLFLIGFIPCIRTFAADFPPVNPAELKTTSCPKQPGASAYVLYREEIDDDNYHYHQVYERIKVLTEEGRKFADVVVPYYYKSYNITDIKGRTIRPDGSIVPFEGKPFEKTIVKGQDMHYKVKAFTLPDVQVGSVLEYRYTLRYEDNMVLSPHWHISGDLYQEKLHFVFKPYEKYERIMLGHNEQVRTIAWTWHTPHNEQPEHKGIGTGSYELSLQDVPAFTEEEYMPPSVLLKYYVYFYYSIGFDKVEEFWREEGKYWNKDVEKFVNKRGGVDAQLAQLIAPSDDPEKKVRKIYAFVSTLENTTYKPERSAEEMKALGLKNNRGAEDVLKQKSGDRDEITRLFVAMVRQAGIPAYAMRVTAREDDYFLKNLLEFNQLDHELAIVQLNGKDVFLDPGTRFTSYGQIYWKLSDCQGLRQTPNGKTEIGTSGSVSYNENVRRRITSLVLNQIGPATGTVEIDWKGQQALTRRLHAIETDAVGRVKMLEDEVRQSLPEGAEVKLVNSPEWENGEKPLEATFAISCNPVMSAGHRLLLPAHLLEFNKSPMFPHAERKYTIYFSYPYAEIDQTTIALPEGMQLEAIPQPVTKKLDWAIYDTQYQQGGRQFVSVRRLVMGVGLFNTTEYKQLKSFYDEAHTNDQMQAVIKGSSHAGN